MAGIPFDLLHSQIVKYAKEMEEKRAEAKNRWKEVFLKMFPGKIKNKIRIDFFRSPNQS